MKVAIAGATGLIGSRLAERLSRQGADVYVISRRKGHTDRTIVWKPEAGQLPAERLEGMDAIINLAGENIAAARWTPAMKSAIRESRVKGTALLAQTVLGLERKPGVFLNASAIGYYGDRQSALLTEESPPADDFLAEVCKAWELAARPVAESGIRTVWLRTGVVLHPKEGALGKMLPIFRLGLGGPLGNGQQYMSWIDLEDEVSAIEFALNHEALSGPINLTAPNPVTNADFTRTLSQVLKRPALFPAPAFGLRLALGEMADALLLSSTRALPKKLENAGFRFQYPDLESSLRYQLAI
jgi:uncharacterized protein (TIGR01777 family)